MKIKANNIDIEVEDTGAAHDRSGLADPALYVPPVVLLIMGLGMQLIAWPPTLVQGLVDAGFRVIRFDNRDIGLSQHFDNLGKPSLWRMALRHWSGLRINPPYTLTDMALDALGVLDVLQIKHAHIVGVSMGGMIAQRLALLAPSRTLSLTSIMSSSGARGLPQAHPSVLSVLMSPAGTGLQAAVKRSVRLYKAIASPGFPITDDEIKQLATAAVERNFHPQGTQRQMVAIVADTTRADALSALNVPTLVVHGKADQLVPFPNGQDTARRIHGARLVPIDGMGHDLPPGVIDQLLPLLVSHFNAIK